ncbi:MAG: hypothetical protein H7230_04460 [Candidatus Parcubacteria bacterium]|nr:hypothetical protein [Candidatus Paceibacterota bacterium]
MTKFNPILDYTKPEFDDGADIILENANEVVVIQSKKSEFNSTNKYIKEAIVLKHLGVTNEYALRTTKKCVGYFITLKQFYSYTHSRFQDNQNIILIDPISLKKEIELTKILEWEPLPFTNATKDNLKIEINELVVKKTSLQSDFKKVEKIAFYEKSTKQALSDVENIKYWNKIFKFVAAASIIFFFIGFSNNFGRTVSAAEADALNAKNSTETNLNKLKNQFEELNTKYSKLKTENDKFLSSTDGGVVKNLEKQIEGVKGEFALKENDHNIELENKTNDTKSQIQLLKKENANLVKNNEENDRLLLSYKNKVSLEQEIASACEWVKFKTNANIDDNYKIERISQTVTKTPLKYINLKIERINITIEKNTYEHIEITYDWKPCLKDN